MKRLALYILMLPIFATTIFVTSLQAQPTYVYSKEGTMLYRRTDMIVGFIKESGRLDIPIEERAAFSICTVDLMNYNFTNTQIKRNTDNGQINIAPLFDQVVKKCSSPFRRRWIQ